MRGTAAATAIVAIIGAAPLSAAVFEPFSELVVFGDSLSDPGNIFAATEGAFGQGFPPPPYFQGRFSNGPTYADLLGQDFFQMGKPSFNFAFGGARAVTDIPPPPNLNIPDFSEQIGLYALDALPFQGDRPLASVLFGANDIFAGLADGTPNESAAAAAVAVGEGIAALSALGFEDIILFNLADLGDAPRFSLPGPLFQSELSDAASEATAIFNQTLAGIADQFELAGLGLIEIDGFAAFEALRSDPEAFGFSADPVPCGLPSDLSLFGIPINDFSDCDVAGFDGLNWDDVHPSTGVHAVLADIVRADVAAAVAPIPLPAGGALLLGALAAMGWVARRSA